MIARHVLAEHTAANSKVRHTLKDAYDKVKSHYYN